MSQPVALITGCSSGIGRALAEAFQAAGYRVWASARKEDDVRALAEAGFQAVQLDVNDAAALARLAGGWKSKPPASTYWSTTPATAPWVRCWTAASRPCAGSSRPMCSPWSA